MNHPFHSFRSLFPVLSNRVYLAACSAGALALPVSDAVDEYRRQLLESGADWQAAMEKMAAAKEKFARLIGAETDEIAVMSSVSDAVSAIALSLPHHRQKNKVAFTDIDFPAIGQIWLSQEAFKNKITVIQSHNGMIDMAQIQKDICDRTLLTCVPHVSYYNGYKQDLKQIADIVHQKGSLLFVDAYQSAGHVPINVKDMDVDILAAGTRKYMLGIPGTAFLYVRRGLSRKFKPQMTGWFGRDGKSAFDLFDSRFAEGAKRFETGTPSFAGLYAADAALEILLEAGADRIDAYLRKLAGFALEYGAEKGLRIAGPQTVRNRSSLISIYAGDAAGIGAVLRERNVITAARKDVIRIAPHFYNTEEDIKQAIDEISALLH
ncbi:aminotransferase class V-fold PLP-dependent enzyme [Bacillus glycinifermentans]|uniref:aminotransferase class V-fold PLP-dependent enzyme n=1 Tax=Bacillus glycinifermentans TaxID=1664069 RepID=UPI002DBA702E|nr:aminotransferase class V-fold PLP-dependent enzyme [Bacillus glycinifermentans]MEC3607606.1 aminotransferase class V-fold PLP-dependent enzyme [Bacillus glycinifermentans]